MILDRDVYFPNPLYRRFILFLKKFFFILVRFLGRPTWGRTSSEVKHGIKKSEFTFLLDEGGRAKCRSCQICERICPTDSIEVIPLKGRAPKSYSFFPLKCMYCNLCVEKCPEKALSFKSLEEGSFDRASSSSWSESSPSCKTWKGH